MALLNYGTTAGLSYVHNWDAEMQRQNYNEQADRQAKIDAENKAKILGDSLAFDHLSNTWDNKLMQDFAQNRIKEIGTFIAQNPDWEGDAGKYMQVNQMRKELTNNDIVSRSMRIQQNYESLVGYMQQNPGAENDPAIQAQLTEYDNYVKYGSANGIPTDTKEFMFKNPDEQFDPQAAIAEAYGQLAAQEEYDRTGKGVGVGATRTYVPDAALQSTAVGLLNGPNAWRYNNTWNSMSEADKQFYQNDQVKWIMQTGKAYTESGVKAGTVFAPQRSGGSGRGGNGGAGGAFSPYLNDFGRLQPNGPSVYSPKVGALLPISDGKMTVTTPLRVKTINENGEISWKVLDGYNNSIVETKASGNVAADPSGQLMAEVVVKVPITEQLRSGETQLFNSIDYFFFEPENTEDMPAYKNVATVEKDVDGNNTGYAYIRSWVPTSADGAAIRNYDTEASTAGNAIGAEGLASGTLIRSELFVNTGTLPDGRRVGVDANGVMYDYATMEVIE